MNQNNTLLSLTLSLVMIIAVAMGMYYGLQRVDKYLELKARDDCAEISHFTVIVAKDNTTVSYPVEEVYRKCLNEKGY